MTKTKVISQDKNYKAIDIGSLSEFASYEFVHPKFKTVDKNRLFLGELLESTGSEISIRSLPPKTSIPFLHKHYEHEEIYIFLKGFGQFQVDDEVFRIREGSVVRISPDGSRTFRNDSEEAMMYMVIQAQVNCLKGYNVTDGYRAEGPMHPKK